MITDKIQLEVDEKILLLVRKHWFILFLQIFGVLVIALLPIFLYILISYIPTIHTTTLFSYTGVFIVFYSGWLLLMWMALFNIWTNYYLDIWTITNKRLITVDQRGFFFRTMASFRLDRLQDTTVSVNGILATLLDYGTLEIQTAGEKERFIAYGLPNPGDIKALILNASETLVSNNLIQTQNTGL